MCSPPGRLDLIPTGGAACRHTPSPSRHVHHASPPNPLVARLVAPSHPLHHLLVRVGATSGREAAPRVAVHWCSPGCYRTSTRRHTPEQRCVSGHHRSPSRRGRTSTRDLPPLRQATADRCSLPRFGRFGELCMPLQYPSPEHAGHQRRVWFAISVDELPLDHPLLACFVSRSDRLDVEEEHPRFAPLTESLGGCLDFPVEASCLAISALPDAADANLVVRRFVPECCLIFP